MIYEEHRKIIGIFEYDIAWLFSYVQALISWPESGNI